MNTIFLILAAFKLCSANDGGRGEHISDHNDKRKERKEERKNNVNESSQEDDSNDDDDDKKEDNNKEDDNREYAIKLKLAVKVAQKLADDNKKKEDEDNVLQLNAYQVTSETVSSKAVQTNVYQSFNNPLTSKSGGDGKSAIITDNGSLPGAPRPAAQTDKAQEASAPTIGPIGIAIISIITLLMLSFALFGLYIVRKRKPIQSKAFNGETLRKPNESKIFSTISTSKDSRSIVNKEVSTSTVETVPALETFVLPQVNPFENGNLSMSFVSMNGAKSLNHVYIDKKMSRSNLEIESRIIDSFNGLIGNQMAYSSGDSESKETISGKSVAPEEFQATIYPGLTESKLAIGDYIFDDIIDRLSSSDSYQDIMASYKNSTLPFIHGTDNDMHIVEVDASVCSEDLNYDTWLPVINGTDNDMNFVGRVFSVYSDDSNEIYQIRD
jgi:hypothetical protein